MDYENVRFSVRNGVASLRLNRPRVRNAMNWAMLREMAHATKRCIDDPRVRAVLISGEGKSFCAGVDFDEVRAMDDPVEGLREFLDTVNDWVRDVRRISCPIVAAIQGHAVGGGLSVALHADIRLAAESATLSGAFASVGLTNDTASTHLLPRLIGWARAAEMMLTGVSVDARKALDWGLVSMVVPDDGLMDAAELMARNLASGATVAYGLIKELLRRSMHNPLDAQLDLEREAICKAAATADFAEALEAVAERRPPRFEGR